MPELRIASQHNLAILPVDERVVELIPTATPLDRKFPDIPGANGFLAVPICKDSMHILSNLGYEPPLMADYDWEKTVPFASQKATASTMVHNQRCYVLNEMGCFDANTEYLTPTGWVRFGDSTGEEESIAQYDRATGKMSWVKPTEFVKLPCKTMVRLHHSRGLDQLISPEHRVILHDRDHGRMKRELITAIDLYDRGEKFERRAPTRKSHKHIGFSQACIPTAFTMSAGKKLTRQEENMLRLRVAIAADGHVARGSRRCVMRLKKERKVYRLRMLLEACGIDSNDRPCKPEGFTAITFKCAKGIKDLTLSSLGLSTEVAEIVADEVLHWDGHVKGSRLAFSTSNAETADFVQLCFTSIGYMCTKRAYTRHPDKGGAVEYVLTPRAQERTAIHAKRGDKRNSNMTLEQSPDGFKYCWKVPSDALVVRRNGQISLSCNTGKTRSALFAFSYLKKHKKVRKMLVVAPLSTITPVWETEVKRIFPHLRVRSVWHSVAKKRRALLETDADVYVINHDGIKTIVHDLLAKKAIDVVLIDELAVFRNKNTDRWKMLDAVCKDKPYVWGMTGSPIPREPVDAWAQMKLITPWTTTKYKKQFKNLTMREVNQFLWVPREDATEIVYEQMQPSVRYTREDCIDLPETMYSERSPALSAEQDKAYTKMRDDYAVQWAEGLITAANAGVATSKLLQIASGFMYDREGEGHALDSGPRDRVLMDLVDECEHKMIIYVPFVDRLVHIQKLLEDKGVRSGLVWGQVAKGQRDAIYSEFQNTTSMKVLIAHPQTTAHGLTLTAADTVVWFSPHPSLEIYEQANARVTRPGQRNKTHIIHIQSTAIERKIYRKLQTRADLQNTLLEMFEEETTT